MMLQPYSMFINPGMLKAFNIKQSEYRSAEGEKAI